MKRFIFIVGSALALPSVALAAKPTCHTAGTVSYMSYTGKVSRIYVNKYNLMLVYFDVGLSAADRAACGWSGLSQGVAAVYPMKDTDVYSKTLYATLLTAKAKKEKITMQMRGTLHGFPIIDKIWY